MGAMAHSGRIDPDCRRPSAHMRVRPRCPSAPLHQTPHPGGIPTGKLGLRINALIYRGFLPPYLITSGKPSGDYDPSETKNRPPRPDASQTAFRQTLLKPRDFLVPSHPQRPHSAEALAGVREPRRKSLHLEPGNGQPH